VAAAHAEVPMQSTNNPSNVTASIIGTLHALTPKSPKPPPGPSTGTSRSPATIGVYRGTSNPTDRAAWLHDVRVALEKYNIGWTMWDYAGGFAVVTRKDGITTPDAVTIKALG